MNFFVTPAQWKVLKHFWKTQHPFTLDSLLDNRVLHCHTLAHFCLYRMLAKHQIIPFAVTEDHDIQFVGTVESREVWKEKKRRPSYLERRTQAHSSLALRRLNDYEWSKTYSELDRLLADRRATLIAARAEGMNTQNRGITEYDDKQNRSRGRDRDAGRRTWGYHFRRTPLS